MLVEIQKRSMKQDERKQGDSDRAKYRKGQKDPTPINSRRPDNYLLQTLGFEMEAREHRKKGKELFELYQIAIQGERAGEHVK